MVTLFFWSTPPVSARVWSCRWEAKPAAAPSGRLMLEIRACDGAGTLAVGLHHCLAPHPIASPSDNFKESAFLNIQSYPLVLSVRLAARYWSFLEKKEEPLPLLKSISTSGSEMSLHTTDFFPSPVHWSPALPCQYILLCETFPCPPSVIHYSSLSAPSRWSFCCFCVEAMHKLLLYCHKC